MDDNDASQRPLVAAATALGIGMGGFVDGILFHQILQVHNMLSAVRPPNTLVNAEVNMFWDGLFHAFTWTMTAVGIALLWRAVKRPCGPLSTRTFVGSMILGWGSSTSSRGSSTIISWGFTTSSRGPSTSPTISRSWRPEGS